MSAGPIPPDVAPAPPRPRRRRWWHRALSLRGLMALVLVAGGAMGWIVRREVERREAIAAVRALGGNVSLTTEPGVKGGTWWTWLARRTGVAWFEEVGWIGIDGSPNSPGVVGMTPAAVDAAMDEVARVGPLWTLDVSSARIRREHLARAAEARVDVLRLSRVESLSDDALAELARCRSIRSLMILMRRADLPRGIFRAVGELTQLESLTLHRFLPNLDCADVAPLGRLRNLKELNLNWATLDEGCLGVLDSMAGMEKLDLGRTRVTDAALRRLVDRMPNLTSLGIRGAALTDAGVEVLARLPRLEVVSLSGDFGAAGQLTDASLATLGRIPTLRRVTVSCGRFGPSGLDALRPLPLDWLGLGAIEPGAEAAIGRLVAGKTFVRLMLHGPGVTDAVLPGLAGSLGPQSALALQRSAITDAAAPALARLPVQALILSKTSLTDAGLATFAAGMVARGLIAQETAITPAGAAAFEAALPDRGLFAGTWGDD